MKNHTKTQLAALELLRARLDPKHPLFAGSNEVVRALSGEAKCYFDTHVLPLLDYLLKGESYYGEAATIVRDHASRKAAADARQRWVATEKHPKCRCGGTLRDTDHDLIKRCDKCKTEFA